MRDDGIRHAAAFITSAFGSYSGCRQYLDDIARACAQVENAPELRPLPLFHMHPGFVGAMTDRVRGALGRFDAPPHVAFTAQMSTPAEHSSRSKTNAVFPVMSPSRVKPHCVGDPHSR